MRRETDEVVRGFLALNALLREELRDIRRLFAARASETKYNPNWRLQPRAPMGTREGGRWIDGGGKDDGPKQARPQPRPRPPQQTPRTPPQQTPRRETPAREVTPQRPNGPQANPARSGIAIPLPRTAPVAGSSISLALRLFRVSPLTLAAGLYGDTPRPDIVTTVRSVPGVDDLVLVESHNRDSDYRSATFRRVLRPRQRTPLIVFGVDTGFASVTPEEL